jgi:hypothetical protein
MRRRGQECVSAFGPRVNPRGPKAPPRPSLERRRGPGNWDTPPPAVGGAFSPQANTETHFAGRGRVDGGLDRLNERKAGFSRPVAAARFRLGAAGGCIRATVAKSVIA